MIGGALGGVESIFFPNEGIGFWPLISMGAILGGTMRVPFTAVIFALQLTHDFNAFLPLFIALFPVVDGNDRFVGVMTRKDLRNIEQGTATLEEVMKREVMTTFLDEPLRLVVYKMAETGITTMPVVERDGSRKVYGTISLVDLLRGRARDLEEERRRERILRLRIPFSFRETQETNR